MHGPLARSSSGRCSAFRLGRFFGMTAVGVGALDCAGDSASEADFGKGPTAFGAGAVQRAVPGLEVAGRLIRAEVERAVSGLLGYDLAAILGTFDACGLRAGGRCA